MVSYYSSVLELEMESNKKVCPPGSQSDCVCKVQLMVEQSSKSDHEEEQSDVDPEELTYLLLKLISPKLKLMNSGTLP